MNKHVWQCAGFEPDAVIDGVRGCVQTYKCRGCDIVVSLPINITPSSDYCPGKEEPKAKPRVIDRRL